jgi:hypothetical protein
MLSLRFGIPDTHVPSRNVHVNVPGCIDIIIYVYILYIYPMLYSVFANLYQLAQFFLVNFVPIIKPCLLHLHATAAFLGIMFSCVFM